MDVHEALVPPLGRRLAVLRSSRPEEVRACVAHWLAPHRVSSVHRATEVTAEVSAVRMGPVSLVHLRHDGDILRVRHTEKVPHYDVVLPVEGAGWLECGGEQADLGGRSAGVISPRTRAELELGDGYSQLHLRIERTALERHLERMLGRPVPGPVRFRVGMDLTDPALASWARTVGVLVRDLSEPGGLSAQGDAADLWTEFLLSGLLRAQPHDYSEAVARRDATHSIPVRVRRVIDLIDDEPAADLSLARLAEAAGVAPRSLQRDFQAYLGVSPRQYVERTRLARARADLAAGAGATVADIAYRWGFGHVSRFAGAYRKQYGETPSQTLRTTADTGRARLA